MANIEEFTLMCKEEEVLAFSVDFEHIKVNVLKKLAHFDKAPFGMCDKDADIDRVLFRFFNERTINDNRSDYQNIVNAFNCKNSFELSFKGHGLSLANHYWFKRKDENLKYKDINFFTNGWDDSFARAVLAKDYEALKKCDLNVPDIVTAGWAVKGWLNEDKPRLYKLGIDDEHPEECFGEVLASRLANRLFDEGETIRFELKKINNKYASVSELLINYDEELLPLSRIVSAEVYNAYLFKQKDKKMAQKFFEMIKNYEPTGLYQFFIKLSCLRSLCFVSDLHFGNISIIRNVNDGSLRIAPLYDLGGAFGSGKTGRSFLTNISKATYFLIYYIFNELDPNWDYSWYNKDRLIGFEDEIREVLSKSEFYTPELIDKVIAVYQEQKRYLDELANQNK